MALSIKTYGQQLISPSDTTLQKTYKARYLSTHKTLKTASWVSLGPGVPLFFLGVLFQVGSINNQNRAGAEKTGKWMATTGAALTIASIPGFIVSHRYKNKAASLSLGNQQVFVPQQNGFTARMQPALSLRISL